MLELLNRYSHGLASISFFHALRERGGLARLESGPVSAEELARELSANRGYLDVALRMLDCLEWIRPVADGRYEATPELLHARAIPDAIMDLYRFPFETFVAGGEAESIEPWLELSERRWNSEHAFLPDFLDGLLVLPLLLTLQTQKRLEVSERKRKGEEQAVATLSLRVEPHVRRAVERLFLANGWGTRAGKTLQLSRAGRFIVDRIFITAVVASYRPMFLRAEELLFGEASAVFARDAEGHETHVERTVNVLGSGFQHDKFFTELSDLIVRCFEGDDYEAQPKYIVDMGCGDGTLLRRLYEAVRDRTPRGKVLDAHPVIPVGVDYNEKALVATSRTLAGIEHIAVHGDIGDPAALVETLRAHGADDLHRVLHVRSFLDHDRPYRPPVDREAAARRTAQGGNVYIDREGRLIPSGEMIQSTVEHLRRWADVVHEHGIAVLEVHCLPPLVTARYRDESESFHFDGYHALSHQFLLDAPTFLACAAEAGLFCGAGRVIGFPKKLPYTRITLSHFERRPYVVRHVEDAFLLEAEGRVLASVRCERTDGAIRVASPSAQNEQALEDLLQFVQQYWSLADAGRVIGIEECRASVAAVDAETSLAQGVARDVRARVAERSFQADDEPRTAERELGTFSFRWALAIFQRMGVMREAGERHDLDALKKRLGIAPKYSRYFDALMRRLAAEGLVVLRGRSIETTAAIRGHALKAIEAQVAEFKESFARRHPSSVALMNFAAACLARYDEILTGRAEVTEVLFDNAEMDVFAAIFRGDVVSDYFNRIVADAAREAVTRLRSTKDKVRILEIGAGTGGATTSVIEALQPFAGSVEYCFTDISLSFVRNAKRLFGNHPWVEFRALNIEEDLVSQGFEPRRYDVVIAANVLHDTRDIAHTLAQTHALLAPGGLLLLNEYTSAKDCLLFSGALLHGYWLFEDAERRLPDTCLLNVPQWSAALEQSSFAMLHAFALPTQSTAECTQSVMLCESLPASPKVDLIALVEQETRVLLGDKRASAYGARRPLMDMGLDSMELVELKSILEQHLGLKLTSKFLFEHETPEKLAAALAEKVSANAGTGLGRPGRAEARPYVRDEDAIAIVGVSCRFPGGADTPERFWQLLESGKDGIVTLPADRWRWPSFVDLAGKHKGIDKAGFLERIDAFDAPFFRVSAKEAELMDPQQRLLLELSWEAMEDGGHRPSELSGRKIGVFVGVCQSDYREVVTASLDSVEPYLGTGSAFSLLANRLSFFYDFKGPSLAVDTACSSSLVALHDAVTAIRRGDCEQALVGAVNLLCSPTISLTYYEAGMLSPNGACRTFDAKADGYVRGEGGAMLLVKPLRTALADGDAIYGIVAGTAVNHGGQAASLTAPKPDAQASVIEAAWQVANVPLDSIGYIEAHGTGTRLGDPIEIGGLTEAFRRLSQGRGEAWPASALCALGSVKTVVGHLEAAAGLAGVVKILLAMQHQAIPGTRNFERLNPEIDLTGSPFRIVTQNEAWPARGQHPRRAGVSSFGFGGSNSHAVIEEYPRHGDEAATTGEHWIPLSARSDAELLEQAKRLLAFLETSSPKLADVAYTLQVGREAMEKRVAFVVRDRDELIEALEDFVAGEPAGSTAAIDATKLASKGRRTHLPTYPFARQRHWVTEAPRTKTAIGETRLHPLVHRNTSDLREQRFSSTFTGEERFLAGHRIGGRRVLPGVAYVEMAREAVARASGHGGSISIANLVWMRPVVVGEDPVDVHISLHPKSESEIRFEIYSGSAEEVVHARGLAILGSAVEAPRVDVAALARQFRPDHSADACYAAFDRHGFEYSGEHRAIAGLRVEAEEVVARLSLPTADAIASFVVHPGLTDSAVQAAFGFSLAAAGTSLALPFELRNAEIYGSCTPNMWAVVRRVAAERFDVDLCDDGGSVRVRLSGLTLRSLDGAPAVAATAQPAVEGDDALSGPITKALIPIVGQLVKVSADQVRPESEFGALGMDSISYVELVDQLSDDYGIEVEPTVFFEHRTVEKFARYLAQTHGAALAKHLGQPTQATAAAAPAAPVERTRGARFSAPSAAEVTLPQQEQQAEAIAIVGMSGRFPMANDVNELWENLASGRDCIGEVPADRWDWRAVYGDPADDNKTNIKWGGFMDGVYDFDPQFFNISPREATLMDPQQRLLMMYVWKAIEDAGYSPSQLSGSNTAIFFATGVSDYGRVIARSTTNIDAYVSTGNVASVGPNRMSYFLDLHGPSDPVETACSSSLVAIHRAVAAMRSGECEMAIVGGVNTILTPDLHISFTKAGMLSEDGRCKTFSANANGYVRSEGVAALLLKPLSAAEAAGDHIYGVILGSAENHGGRANTLTSPNPQAQAALLKRAYKEAGVDPATVSYIEAHGTGTALGDPIEVEGLKSAFAQISGGHCGIGSVKSNIGHLELAAGIAGVIKVLLQMKHRTLAPTLHCETINPYIHLEDSPFYVVQEKAEWSGDAPRRAGVSSFGFGGSNAHIVLEEYVGNRTMTATTARQAILLSARTPERLREQAEQLLAAMRAADADLAHADLANVAYTLQVGREAMDQRLAFIVGSTAELTEKLDAFLAGEKPAHHGRAQKRDEFLSMLAADEAFQMAIAKWIEQGRLEMLLDLWIKGLDLDWNKLHAGAARQRVSLPTYPFARERYAVETSAFGQGPARAAASTAAVLHPLLHANTSDLREQRYSTRIDGEFSPAAHLEMARAAIERAFPALDGSTVLELKDVVWAEQNAPNASLVHIALTPGAADDVEYEIYAEDVVLSQGRGTWVAGSSAERQGLSADYVLHPATIDRVGSLAALESLRILAPCTPDMTVRRHSSASLDLCDGAGTVCVQMRGITWRQMAAVVEAPIAPARREIALQMPAERKKPSAIALAKPGIAPPATAADRMPISLAQTVAPSTVRLFDDGEGVFTLEMESAAGLRSALEKARQEPSLRVLLLSGLERASDRARMDCHDAIASFPSPTIAVLREGASGAAFLAASLCDLMVCSEEASYGYANPTPTEAMLLNERFGERLAHDFLISDAATGRELREKGWTCPILPAEQVEPHARKLAATLAAKSANTLRVVKRHFARSIAPLLDTLTASEPNMPEAAVVRIVEAADLAEALQSGCNAVVLTGEIPDLPETDIPIVAALSGNVTGRAWMNALLCDACVYGADAVLSSAGIPESAAPLFAARLGNDAAAEILLTGNEYPVAGLRPRVGTITIAEDVVAEAVRVAERLAMMPAATRASLKKQLPTAEPVAGNEESFASITVPTTIALRTNVVTATAHPDGVVVLKMEERQAKNAFSDALIEGLTEAFAHIDATPGYKVVVLTGHDQCFSSGGTKEILLAVQEGRMKFTDINVWELPLDCKLPVIAALQGHGIGGGWALGMFADLALLSEDSRYWNPYVEYGFSPGDGATWVFPQTLGRDLGIESMLTAQHYTGAELRARGLRQHVAPRAEIVPAAMALATRIARMPRTRLMEIKRRLTAHVHDVLEETYRLELAMHDETIVGHADTLARIQATYYEGSEKPAASQERAAARAIDSNDLAAIAAGMKALLASELQLREADIDDDTQFVEMGLDSISGVTWVRKINAKYRTSIAATAIYSHPTLTLFSRYVAEEAMVDEAPVAPMEAMASEDVAAIAAAMRALLASELQLREADIDDDAQFVDMGLDSISGVTWIRKVNAKYGTSIAATSIYSYPTLTQLSRYVAEEAPAVQTPAAQPPATKTLTRRQRSRFTAAAAAPSAPQSQAIAVIGMAGQFAKATNLEQFWRNIAEGRDCIEPIPSGRWNVDEHYRAGAITPGKTISRWLGGLEHYDRFDSLFFNISPTEAESIDPQQRLFLEACWHSIENAGYDARRLSGSKCGVFVGCAFGDYHLLSREQQLSAESFTGDAASILAARVSYLLNLRGPSLAIDTACSSSLVALAQACDNLVAGHSDMALAGGVYVTAGPEMHIRSSQAGMLSPNGRCFTFDQRADGLVMGEGVGVVLLKRLADAERDGDIIHAVLEGWGVNQDGKTNGITAPNAESQASLEQSVYDKYRIDPANIQLIEAHGTGTKLGDPIEVEGLKTAFKKYTRKTDYCALGSVKSNIGHCAQAAGIAGVLKLVLAVKNRQLPPTIHFERLNEHIELAGSPFYVNTRLQEWKGDVRRAAISSFGFSGTNAHMVIGEYVPPVATRRPAASHDAIVPLSARTPEQLREKAADLLAFLRANSSVDLHAVAYTLQTGRAAMDERLGFVVRSVAELIDGLAAWLAGERPACECRQGRAKRGKGEATSQLLASWVEGCGVDWERLHGDGRPQRIALPLYPFARERYWIETKTAPQQHAWTLTGDEFFLAEHLVRIDGKAQKVLPGVACLELVRTAVAKEHPSRAIELRDTVWLQPIVVAAPLQIRVVLSAVEGDAVAYEIRSQDVVHCQGRAVLGNAAAQEQIDLEPIRRRTARALRPADVYAAFARMGIEHGPAFQAIAAIQHGDGESLTRLHLPDAVAHTANDYALHPSLMDAALQGYMVLIDGWLGATQPRLPFALESLRILAPCKREMVVWVRHAAGSDRVLKLDFDLCDERGNVCVQMRGFSPRLIGKEAKAGMLLAAPVWQPAAAAAPTDMERHVVLCGLPNVSAATLETLIPRSFCTSMPAEASYSDVAVACFERIQNILRGKPEHAVGMQVVIADELFAGVAGMLKTAALENPLFAAQVMLVPPSIASEELAARLRAETPGRDALVRHERGVRHVQSWKEVADTNAAPVAFKDDGVYLITGGRGGVGTLFTREILAKTRNARVILTSRSASEATARVRCRQTDLEDLRDVEQLIASILEEHGRLDGILHCAGMIADDFLVKKSSEDFRRVLGPKVAGTLHLDLATRHLDLDFFVLFSSIASAFGNVGQADYAAANGFLDRFAAVRNQRQRGRTCSIHWPFWEDGGMRSDAESLERMQQLTGLQPMATETGMEAFARSLMLAQDEVLVMTGDLAQIRRSLFAPSESPVTVDAGTLAEKTQDYLRRELAGTFKIAAEKLDPHEPLETYGVDSILAMRLTSRLEQTFGALSKTLFFEYQTIAELTKYFLRAHAARLTALFGPAAAKPQPQTSAAVVQAVSAPAPAIVRVEPASQDEPIAIVGLSGRYPGALDVEAYWNNLRDGKDCITDIPKERWDWQQYFSETRGENGRHSSKWGGFIEGVDEFDALFFNISPKEARATDPQERLFLQHAWAAIEDAGYTRASLHVSHEDDLPGQVGVYAGVWCSEYQLLGVQASEHGEGQGVAVSVGSIANRVSYALDLHGPSITLDTMCSSSLTAIHLAYQDLRLGRTRMAIAGGVNVSIHPNKYLMLSAAQALASDGRCRSFGEGGDGYVPAEGVGVIVLKRLSDAERDGDHVYGTIRASALNHGGKTNGYTVPNPQAQASAIGRALRESGIDARHISYVESHGTGTKLGDPIEIAALDKAFRQSTTDTQFCAIGSVKSNIGHCESAAGIAGLTKILLQMQHGQLVPSLHTAELNAHVDFDRTPFVVNRALRPWEQPRIDGRSLPRIAGISSFGAGGSNAHLILEEYQAPVRPAVAIDSAAIVLSARTTEQLQQRAAQLLRFVRTRRNELDLASLAYTLQIGREAMDVRFGFVAASIEQAIGKLEAFVAGDLAMEEAWQGDVKRNKEALAVFGADADLQQTVDKWIAGRKLSRLLDLWVKGLDVEWTKLYDATPRRISLPSYPFAKDRHWIDVVKPTLAPAKATAEVLHPLLHRNVSTLHEQRYRTVLTGDEPFAAACLEMARAAMEHASPSTDASTHSLTDASEVIELRDVAWSLPLVPGRKEVSIVLTPGAAGEVELEIFSGTDGQEIVHCQGRAMRSAATTPARVELAQLRPLPATMADADALHAALLACNEAAPAGLQSLRFFSPCTGEMFVSMRGQDVDLCDARGNVCVQMRGLSWPAPTTVVEIAAPPVRREIPLSEIVPISGTRKPAAIALAAPSASLLQKSAGSARISLKETGRPATPPVKLHDDGNGTFIIEIVRSADAASIQAALERAQQEPGIKALLVRGLDSLTDASPALLQAIAAFPLPTIAMLRNDTIGVAFVAAALCDFLVCNEDASYGASDPMIARRFSQLRAQDLLMGAMTGRQLRERGWTCPIVAAAEVESHARTLATSFAQKSDESLRLLKRHLARRIAPSDFTIQRQERANRVLSIAFDENGLSALASVEECEAVVLTNLPETMSDEDVASFQRILAGVAIPVIAALTGNARGNAWLAAQLCDACVSSSDGIYSAKDIAPAAAAAFSQRLGKALGTEIVLTGADYSGADLQRRAGVPIADREEVLATAMRLAEAWPSTPIRTSWSESVASLPAEDEALDIATPTVVFRSPVVTATAHPDGVVVIAMEDREAKNMFSDAFLAGVQQAFAHIAATPAYKVVVLTGYDRYFVSGGTKEGLLAIQQGKTKFTDSDIYHVALSCKVPVIAAMQGHAIGAGLAMGMFADLVVLGEESRYISPYMGYGFTPGAGATYILPEVIGRDLAREGLLTAQHSTGAEWRARGLRLNILPRAEVLDAAMALARQMARASRRRLLALKQALTAHIHEPLAETYERELAMHEQTFVGRSDTLALIEDTFHEQVEIAAPPAPVMEAIDSDALPSVAAALRSLLANELLLRESDIDDQTQFVDLGLESISAVTWLKKINEKYQTSIDATKIYSHPTLAQLAPFVMTEAQKSGALQKAAPVAPKPAAMPVRAVASKETQTLVSRRKRGAARFVATPAPAQAATPARQAIAVVGMAGQFPQARNLEEFWQNLAVGKNCITEVPADRWALQTYYQPGGAAAGKTNCPYVGALPDHDRFDPLFFNISPTEAENMDPQQRLFLQSCWHAIEHAGYDARALSGTRAGVFAGCGTSDYHDYFRTQQLSAHAFTGGATSILAARISYFLNLQGPCVAIDTACSSSLVAIAQACDSLNAGGSDVALAGGVYVMSGPSMHVMTAQAGMLSPEGKCFTFDQRADGFVPGEGVGVVMLKRLADAERDGDVIHGVIEGWGINQDGKTNGITAPNPESQTRLEQEVYDRHGIDPAHIQLIEAHGTGTKLGDPIEVEGLKQAFKKYTQKQEYCAIGSVKSNIGHTLMAAGVAGVLKIILALQHKKLPPTINFERLNEHIDLAGTPFYVNTRLQDWDLHGAPHRRAAISSFAFSGTNAHLVIGEHAQPVAAPSAPADAIVPLSARTAEQLHEKARDLLAFLRQRPALDLADLAYTLQTGRVPMDERLGFIVGSVPQLTEKLEAFLAGKLEGKELQRGRVKRGGDESLSILVQDDDARETILEKWMAKRKLVRLLDLWIKGWDLDWNRLHGEAKPRRITLPVYPFAKERYWLHATTIAERTAVHPLAQRNTSDLNGQRYTSAFSGDEFFLTDHRVRTNGGPPKKVLPGSAYLEMARAALEQASPDRQKFGVELRNVAWLKPVVVTEQAEVSISLIPSEDGHVDYEIFGGDGDQRTTHCRGEAVFHAESMRGKLDLHRLRAEMQQGRLEAAEIYARFEKMGLRYGPAHQGVLSIDLGERQALAALRLAASMEAYVLHPGLIDSAFQAAMGLFIGEMGDLDKPRVPFLLDSLHVVAACTPEMFAWVRRSHDDAGNKVDIDVCDPQGNVCIRMRGFAVRELDTHRVATLHPTIPAALLPIKKQDSSFDREFYKKLIADVANDVVTIDDAVRLK